MYPLQLPSFSTRETGAAMATLTAECGPCGRTPVSVHLLPPARSIPFTGVERVEVTNGQGRVAGAFSSELCFAAVDRREVSLEIRRRIVGAALPPLMMAAASPTFRPLL